MIVLIVGARGSMGKRYQAILDHLEISHVDCDKEQDEKAIIECALNCDKIILCTPTQTHYELLKKLIPVGKPILCEKPITTNIEQLNDIFNLVKKHNNHFSMVFQYSELIRQPLDNGPSYYDYFRTGNDGLMWDCLQIIGLANSDIELSNKSPIWSCKINGQVLNLSEMDSAYLSFVKKWIDGKINQNLDNLYNIHKKVDDLYYETFGELN